MIGRVFNIQRFSLHDGPGIRTTVFMMGCNLHCRWCHNPEGLHPTIRLQYAGSNCLHCGSCIAVCPNGAHAMTENGHTIDFSQCTGCGACISVCPAQALSFSGREYTPEALSGIITRDLPFYKRTGGVTFSGGEPLLQAPFVAQTMQLCKEKGVPSVAVDTAGLVARKALEAVLPWADHFLYDIKAVTEEIHIAGTGVSNARILDNLLWLDTQGKSIFIRVPVIPGINDNPREIEKIGDFVRKLKTVRELRLIPYHTFGREKYATLGEPEPELFQTPTDETMEKLRLIARR